MSASSPAQVDLRSSNTLLEISLIDADFRPRATGVGGLEATVEPGIYQIVTRAGPSVERRLVSLGPGETLREDGLGLAYPSTAPVAGSTTTHEYHEALAHEATRRAPETGAASWLAVMIRDVRGQSGPPLDVSALSRVEILDRSMRPVPNLGTGWDLRAPDAAAAWSGHLPPGPYLLRVRGTDGEPVDQALWVAQGWQTVVFLTADEQGPKLASASVHMVDVNLPWSPWEEGVAQAAELATLTLREGRAVVPPSMLNLLLNTKFRNPVFGLIGAHALLLQPSLDVPTVDTVLNNLGALLPGSPDVVALSWIYEERRAAQDRREPVVPPGLAGIDWPPMLLLSYEALLRMDARDPGALPADSVAERIAGNLVVQGIWTAWRPVQPDAERVDEAALPPSAGDPLLRPAETGTILAELAPSIGSVAARRLPDPATARIARYLASVAVLEGDSAAARFAGTSTSDLALATRLPTATVARSVRELYLAALGDGPHHDDGPPDDGGDGGGGDGGAGGGGDGGAGGGGGGGGGLSLPIALLGAVVLLLLVGLGWAVGSVIIDGTDETPSPDPTATAVATATVATPTPSSAPTPTPTPSAVPDVRLDPDQLDLGAVLIRDRRLARIEIASVGTAPATVLEAAVAEGGQDYLIVGEDCAGRTLAPGERCGIDLAFSPTAVGNRPGTLELEIEGLGQRVAGLTGVGEARDVITIKPDPAFPRSEWMPIITLAVGEEGPVRLADIRLVGQNPESFELDSAACLAQPELAAGATCDLLLRLHPDAEQTTNHVATLVVETAAGVLYQGVLRWDYVE